MVQYKSQVGGWWNLALGKRPPQLQDHNSNSGPTPPGVKKWWSGGGSGGGASESSSSGNDVEDRINALAEALGMPSKELALAIAGAVKEYVPPASLSSVSSAAAKETGKSSETVKALLGDDESEERGKEGVIGGAEHVFGSVVGLDEPPEA